MARPVASWASSAISTFTGVPESSSSEPACAAKASGMSSCDGGCRMRSASTTTIGTSAATAPFTLMSAVSTATSSETSTTMRARPVPARPVPARPVSCCPAQVVSPLASSPSPTTNSAAMNTTTGSPKPATVCSKPITPVA